MCGIHGSGKTYLGEKLKEILNIDVYTASQLIRDYKEESVNANKLVVDVEGNQTILVNCVNRIKDKRFILDGHLCLLDQDKQIVQIPSEVIELLSPKAILLKVASLDVICERLNKRDKSAYDIDFINKFQIAESKYANELSKKLGIPLYEISDKSIAKEQIEEIKRRI